MQLASVSKLLTCTGSPGKVLWGKLLLPTGLGKSDRPG